MKDLYQTTRDHLNTVSPSFCLAKWKWLTLHLGMGTNHSCYHPPVHAIDPREAALNPQALHNTPEKKQERRMMMEGKRPAGCHYCWNTEDLDSQALSDRIIKSGAFGVAPYLEEIKRVGWGGDVYPYYLEVSFSNKCNFACSYCSPGQSGRWQAEIMALGSYPVAEPSLQLKNVHPHPPEEENPLVEAFWRWIPECYPHLKVLRITGGEPLITNSFYRMLQFVEAHPHPDLCLSVNTNLAISESQTTRLISTIRRLKEKKLLKEFRIFTSIDSVFEQAEYIRFGLDYSHFVRQVERICQELPDQEMVLMITFGVLSLFRFTELLDQILLWKGKNKNLWFDVPRLTDPRHFNIMILPRTALPWFEKIDRWFESHRKLLTFEEFQGWKNLYRFWGEYPHRHQNEGPDHRNLRQDFLKFCQEHDRRRGTDLKRVFPEVLPLMMD